MVGAAAPAKVVWALAVTVPTPEVVDAFSKIVAMPFASVKAVPMAGLNTPKLGFVVNVTTAPTRGAPLAVLKAALTFAGLVAEMELRGALVAGSVRETARDGAPAAEKEMVPVKVVAVVAPASVVWPVAVTVPAPAAVDAFRVTDAMPLASVSAVPIAGSIVPRIGLVVKRMTAPTIGVPLPDLKVAVTLAGSPIPIEVRAVVEFRSVSATVRVGVPVSVNADEPTAPLPHPPMIAANPMIRAISAMRVGQFDQLDQLDQFGMQRDSFLIG